jgi:hypothetical protein
MFVWCLIILNPDSTILHVLQGKPVIELDQENIVRENLPELTK